MRKTSLNRRRLDRLERLQAAVREGKPLLHSPGLSALLAMMPARPDGFASETTPAESQWMRRHSDLLAASCPPRPHPNLADCLAFARERIATARKLMSETV